MPKFIKKTHTKDSPADHNYANDLERRIADAIDPIAVESSLLNFRTSDILGGGGTTTYYTRSVVALGRLRVVSIFGVSSTGAGTKNIGYIPEGYRPNTSLVVQVYTTDGSSFISRSATIGADGTIAVYFSATEAGKVYHLNFTYTV
ncbi:hypothetical protein G7059_01845 [Erysipelothrix sp. HDW6A]|uniref:hypothetical protein n=1 Tax=Erysipelothrix sp. HDW6A TaxID=2714928 RepID=UPI0014090AC2|nr:hypothetical protein [Erysipelothrix sp. HDW6A]QIK56676.1 hypothetical protein G7059_01845 [Erysipelothrix sp. HDW6A]